MTQSEEECMKVTEETIDLAISIIHNKWQKNGGGCGVTPNSWNNKKHQNQDEKFPEHKLSMKYG